MKIRSLPDPKTRWTAARKLEVLRAINNGLLTKEEAEKRYLMSEEEIKMMKKSEKKFGFRGLKTTMLQKYRISHVS